jgi:hypothetical protein
VPLDPGGQWFKLCALNDIEETGALEVPCPQPNYSSHILAERILYPTVSSSASYGAFLLRCAKLSTACSPDGWQASEKEHSEHGMIQLRAKQVGGRCSAWISYSSSLRYLPVPVCCALPLSDAHLQVWKKKALRSRVLGLLNG